MLNRYRVEIYDADKNNDLTLYSEIGVDREHLTELVFSNIKNFNGRVNAYTYDQRSKKKTAIIFLNEIVVTKAKELGQPQYA